MVLPWETFEKSFGNNEDAARFARDLLANCHLVPRMSITITQPAKSEDSSAHTVITVWSDDTETLRYFNALADTYGDHLQGSSRQRKPKEGSDVE